MWPQAACLKGILAMLSPDALRLAHRAAGALALVTLALFQISTAVSETALSHDSVVAVKRMIVWGLLPLILCLAATGASGATIARKPFAGLVRVKLRRMKIAAANGLLILAPAALYLYTKATAGEFDMTFYAVQGLEIVAGLLNVTMLSLNMRDGLMMTRKKRRRAAQGE
jgi:hypothetical protein